MLLKCKSEYQLEKAPDNKPGVKIQIHQSNVVFFWYFVCLIYESLVYFIFYIKVWIWWTRFSLKASVQCSLPLLWYSPDASFVVKMSNAETKVKFYINFLYKPVSLLRWLLLFPYKKYNVMLCRSIEPKT